MSFVYGLLYFLLTGLLGTYREIIIFANDLRKTKFPQMFRSMIFSNSFGRQAFFTFPVRAF